MKAVTWHGRRDIRVDTVDDPRIEHPTDAVIRVTTTGLCGSDLHLYEVLTMFMEPGDILGHEPMGIVEAVGADVMNLSVGDRVVVPFNISCGHCFMCERDLYAQCETTQVVEQDKGAALFGYTKLYGQVPGAQAEYLRVPHADFGPIRIDSDVADERLVYLSDVVPTAWQGVEFADVAPGDTLAVLGLGPIGQMASRIARHRNIRVIAVDPVPERREMAERNGIETIDTDSLDNVVGELRDRTEGRGPAGVVDAVGMEAHGAPATALAQRAVGLLPDSLADRLTRRAGIDRLAALTTAIEAVRRGGTVSISGVYGGALDPLPMMTMFDKGITLRMGQAHVKRWIDDALPLVIDDDDPLGTGDLATHVVGLEQAPDMYEAFQRKDDGAIKVLFQP
ncbi:zinc-dependent alcohol dehydrogenase [Ilumatobacter nonamiensis]|uniref:zinc-dependent alcohol dehydrogenase n=1 Tax=Ilumatobacter nonamiensis TaxID=467093 RepID=UPI000347EBF3|nr:zinc-dependent alcohol dehydrogenase [Ilumatobacter nonamiensis]